jgi:guanylate kinase
MTGTRPVPPLLVVIGPSGCGKSSAVRRLCELGAVRVHPTWTTRPRRPDEAHGSLEHRFVDDATFDALAEHGAFLDTVSLFGLPHRYGLPPIRRSADGRVDVVMLRAPLVERFDRVVGPPRVVVQIEDDADRAAARLRARESSAEELRRRLADNERELVLGRRVADHVLVNDGTIAGLAAALAWIVRPMSAVAS